MVSGSKTLSDIHKMKGMLSFRGIAINMSSRNNSKPLSATHARKSKGYENQHIVTVYSLFLLLPEC